MTSAMYKGRAKKLKGKHLISVETFLVDDALKDPQLGGGVRDNLIALGREVASGEAKHDCFVCCKPWSYTRKPDILIIIKGAKMAGKRQTVGAMMCNECSNAGRESEINGMVIKEMRNDDGSPATWTIVNPCPPARN